MRFIFLYCVFFLVLTEITCAQLVNIESKRKLLKDGLQGYVGLSFKLTENTKQIIQLQNDVSIQYTKKAHTLLFLNDLSIMQVKSKSESDDLINRNFQHIRYNYTFKDTSSSTLEFFVQRQVNKLKFLDFRFLSGTGFRFRIIDNEKISLFLAPLLMYEYEIEKETDSTQNITSLLKGDFYFTISLQLGSNIRFSQTTYYHPALFDFKSKLDFEPIKDYRLSNESALIFKILAERLTFSLIFDINFDSRPPRLFITEFDKKSMLFYEFRNEIRFVF